MPISLQKGQKVNLSKDNAGLAKVIVGLGWDEAKPSGGGGGGFFATLFGGAATTHQAIDCDASAIMLKNGKFVDRTDLVYFGNLKHKSGTVNHMGDNLTGEGEGDDEQIMVDLTKVPANVERIAFTVTIYEAEERRQNFGQVSNSYIRLVDESNEVELIHYDLGEDFSIETAVVVGELYRHNGEWKFNAIGSGYQGGLAALCNSYGVDVE